MELFVAQFRPILATTFTAEVRGVREEGVGSRLRRKVIAGINTDEDWQPSSSGVNAAGGDKSFAHRVAAEYF
jgi:hypothetical protein